MKSIYVICMLLLFTQSHSANEMSILEFVKEGCRANDNLVYSGMGHLICAVEFPEPLKNYQSEIFFAFEGKKLHYDSEEFFPKERIIVKQAYDGEKTTTYRCRYNLDEGIIFPSGSISGENIINMDNVPISYGIALHSKSLEELLSQQEAELIGTDTINGELCYRIRTAYEGVPIEMLVNSMRGFRAQEVKVSNPRGTATISILLEEFERYIWFPKSIRVQFPLEISGEFKEIIVKEDFKINVEVPDSLFMVKFPSGIPVYDSRTGRSFRAE